MPDKRDPQHIPKDRTVCATNCDSGEFQRKTSERAANCADDAGQTEVPAKSTDCADDAG